jgi:hypothetical protein
LPDLAAFVVRCEEAGFDGVGIHDHPSSGRDAYLALALASRATAAARRRRRRVRSNVDPSQEQKRVTDASLSAGRRAPHD